MTPLSPKTRFLQNKLESEAHAKLMASALFEKAADAAMLQTALNLPIATASDVATANYCRIQGAQLFLSILMTLGDPIPERPTPPDASLNFDATKIK